MNVIAYRRKLLCTGSGTVAGTCRNINGCNATFLQLIVNISGGVAVLSEDDEFVSYYPESFRFPTTPNESVRRIVGGKVYLSAWVEEGWDDDNNCATEEYRYYEKMIVRDFKGNVLSETIGSLQQHPDGTWWIS